MSLSIRDFALERFDPSPKRKKWLDTARPEQLTPGGDWNIWLMLAGRGFGKTRSGAEDVAEYMRAHPGHRVALVAATFTDGRDTMVEGESGLLACLEDDHRWNRSLGELIHSNGSRAKIYSAEEPDRLRGPQHHRAWADELAAWEYIETWDQLTLGLRLGERPRVVVTTTPRPIPLIRELVARDDVHITRGSTFDNAENLSQNALKTLRARYEGTTLGRQELYGEIIDQIAGALWKMETIDANRWRPEQRGREVLEVADFHRLVVAVDPAVSNTDESDWTGIVVAGMTQDCPVCDQRGCAIVLEDRSLHDDPVVWATEVVDTYNHWRADTVIGEVNNGGDLVELTIRSQDRTGALAYETVRATRGKAIRAQPVAALYEQGRVHHLHGLPELEDQMVSWSPDFDDKSPDRLDAMVWALTHLMLEGEAAPVAASAFAPDDLHSPSYWRNV